MRKGLVESILWVAIAIVGAEARADQPVYDDCDAVLFGGVFNVDTLRTNVNVYSAASDAMCLTEANRDSAKSGWGMNLGVPIDGVPLQIGGSSTNESAAEWSKKHCSDSRRKNTYGDVVEHIKQVASQAVLSSWAECKAGRSYGFSCSIANTVKGSTGMQFSFKYRYTPLDLTDSPPKIRELISNNARCSAAPKAGDAVTSADEIACAQIDARQGVLMMLRTTKGACTRSIDVAAAPQSVGEICAAGEKGAGESCRLYRDQLIRSKCGVLPSGAMDPTTPEVALAIRCASRVGSCFQWRASDLDRRDLVCSKPADDTNAALACEQSKTSLKAEHAVDICEDKVRKYRPLMNAP